MLLGDCLAARSILQENLYGTSRQNVLYKIEALRIQKHRTVGIRESSQIRMMVYTLHLTQPVGKVALNVSYENVSFRS